MIGNGLARPAGDGRWELAATPPIATYLVTLVAGPYFSTGSVRRLLADQVEDLRRSAAVRSAG